ncbi:MAG: hypothetical protein GTN76_14510, partial [Candidatus Aenigmarchaeota archaeon]|nr:hypothetical protein [Candidatus Aenigmarchaeota archaeon]
AQAEGLHSIYYQSPSPTIFSQKKEIEPPSLRFKPYKVFITVPLGKLIYELAVQFGNINIRWDNTSVRLHCDGRGDTLDHWLHRDLRIYKQDFDTLKFPYVQYGKFSLKSVRKVWKDMEKSLMGEV